MTFSLSFRPDDEFEDEPEDELASAGMHVVEKDEDDDEDLVKKIDADEEIIGDDAVEDPKAEAEEEVEEDADAIPDGLAELEKLEKLEKENSPALTFGGDDEE